MVIIIFGFSGAGKSTLADKLGATLGLRVIHPSSIVKNLLQKKEIDVAHTTAGSNFWESSEGVALFKSRLHEQHPVDLIGDEILLNEIKKGDVVMDSWTMPWLSSVGIKIFLKAPHDVRAGRVSKRSGVGLRRASQVVRLKDCETRALYRRLRGFDMKKDQGVFDLIVDVRRLSAENVLKQVKNFIMHDRSQGI